MADKSVPRPGGRSARVQAAVHHAVRELQNEPHDTGLTIPLIATRAGVTPSTIYRRWGTLAQLLADVALEQMQPDQAPADTGAFGPDLSAWLEQYFDEISSVPGRNMLKDVLGTPGHESAGKCDGLIRQQIETLRQRAIARGEQPPATGHIVETAIAPLMYRLLFANHVPTLREIHEHLRQSGITQPASTEPGQAAG
ncbi:hypothetical protein CDEF62S_04654 [Castellaniella defragrans]